MNRIPSAANAEIDKVVNSPEAFTPDTRMIMGESSEVDGYFIAAGANGNAISLAGGVGRYTAELIAFGETDVQLWPVDVRRFVKLHNNRKFLRDRARETVGKQYSLKYPTYGMSLYKTGRKLRTSPLHTRLLDHGAVYGENLGYERPLWFDKAEKDFYIEDQAKGSFGKPKWFECVRNEYMACRKGVAVIDMSSFTKFELKSAGREVVDFLQNICSNDIDCPIGHVVHTGMQNHKGGYENDCSVVQLEPNSFMIISPVTQQTRNMKWLSEHFPEDGSVLMSDITSLYAAINLVGPKAVDLLSELTDESLSKADFPQFTFKVS
jgi:pyruvate dehydrogenase phosphatase regulatory subunit